MKERLDKILVSKGIVKSRNLASAFIIEGKVFVNGKKILKPGTLIDENSSVSLEIEKMPYVSRGGLKLEAALKYFQIDVNNKIIMDVGSSTGGFTDCVLKQGAKKVFCIDVGYGQLDWSLRNDPRVFLMERTNARYLDEIVSKRLAEKGKEGMEELIEKDIDIIVIDVSFISLTKILPVLKGFLKKDGLIIALVKPQFEVGRGEVGRGGIVKDEEKRMNAVKKVSEELNEIGLETFSIYQSPIKGQKGNIEYFLLLKITQKYTN